MPRLKVVTPKVALDLEFDRAISIGRHVSNSLPLPDAEVSRRHAQIFPRDNHFLISDLGSRNGIFVNGEKFKEQALEEGDEIAMGMTLLFFDPPPKAPLGELLSARGEAIWNKLPDYDEFQPAGVTTFSPVELDEMIERSLAEDGDSPILPESLRSKFLSFALSLDRHKGRKQLCIAALEFACERVGGERLAVMASDPKKKELRLQGMIGVERAADLVVGKDILRIAVDTEKAVHCGNCPADFRFRRLAQRTKFPLHSFMASPIFCADRYYGFIYIDQAEGPTEFDFKSLFQVYLIGSLLGKCLHWFKAGRAKKGK